MMYDIRSLLLADAGKRNGGENTIGVIVPFCGGEPDVVLAVSICDLIVVIWPEQVGVAAGKRVRRECGRDRVGPRTMPGAVPDLPAGHDLDNEVLAAVRKRGL